MSTSHFIDDGRQLVDGRRGQIAVHQPVAKDRVLGHRLATFLDEVTRLVLHHVGKRRRWLQRARCGVLNDEYLQVGFVEEVVNHLLVFVEGVHLAELIRFQFERLENVVRDEEDPRIVQFQFLGHVDASCALNKSTSALRRGRVV